MGKKFKIEPDVKAGILRRVKEERVPVAQAAKDHGVSEGATRIPRSSMSEGSYSAVFTFNATGEGWIDFSGITKLGIREVHDITDTAVADGTRVTVNFSAADESGTTQDPKLVVVTQMSTA